MKDMSKINDNSEILECILGIKELPNRKSCLQLALESARFHLGRDKVTGKGNDACFYFRQNKVDEIEKGFQQEKNTDEADLFSGVILYLIILEQLGTIFDCSPNNHIINILKRYADGLSMGEIKAIKNLRNSLAHNYGLVAYNPKDKPICKFILSFSIETNVVKKSIVKWNKKFDNKSDDCSILIYVFPLIDLVEDIITKIIKEFQNKKLSCRLSKEELEARFTILF